MKKLYFSGAAALLAGAIVVVAGPAQAYLATASLNEMEITVVGIYTTADPTCATDWSATVPVSAGASAVNAITSPVLGSTGAVSSEINCVMLILKGNYTATWSAGTYTSSTQSNSDSVCDSGGSTTWGPWAVSGQAITWPASTEKPSQDMSAAGLPMTTTGPADFTHPTGNEIYPIYLSTYSLCLGTFAADTAGTSAGCYSQAGGFPNVFQPPTAPNDHQHGFNNVAPAASTKYKFVFNPSTIIGYRSDKTCGPAGAPLMGFQAAD